jgi:hypothetical protein
MYVYFDIETTGLSEVTDDFVCGVSQGAGGVFVATDAAVFADHLLGLPEETIFVTFNGAAFDFRFLAAKTESVLVRARLAQASIRRHVDICFAFLCDHGYRTSMNSFASELGVAKIWNGAEAAASDDVEKIIAYCTSDVEILKHVHETAVAAEGLVRLTKAGAKAAWTIVGGEIATVDACMALIARMPPDQSWQGSPVDIPGTLEWTADCLRAAFG